MQRLGQCELHDVIALLGLFVTPGWHLTGALLVTAAECRMKRFEIIAAAALAGFAGYILFESTKLRIGSFRVPQTGIFPTSPRRPCGAAHSLASWCGRSAGRNRNSLPDKIASEGWFRIGATLTTLLGFALLLERSRVSARDIFAHGLLLRAIEAQRWPKVLSSRWSLHCSPTAYLPGCWVCRCPPEF